MVFGHLYPFCVWMFEANKKANERERESSITYHLGNNPSVASFTQELETY